MTTKRSNTKEGLRIDPAVAEQMRSDMQTIARVSVLLDQALKLLDSTKASKTDAGIAQSRTDLSRAQAAVDQWLDLTERNLSRARANGKSASAKAGTVADEILNRVKPELAGGYERIETAHWMINRKLLPRQKELANPDKLGRASAALQAGLVKVEEAIRLCSSILIDEQGG